jgi:hypothetical protein
LKGGMWVEKRLRWEARFLNGVFPGPVGKTPYPPGQRGRRLSEACLLNEGG